MDTEFRVQDLRFGVLESMVVLGLSAVPSSAYRKHPSRPNEVSALKEGYPAEGLGR